MIDFKILRKCIYLNLDMINNTNIDSIMGLVENTVQNSVTVDSTFNET